MQSTTLLRPPEPSCLPSAPAITNFFSPSLNPYTSLFIPSPSITHFHSSSSPLRRLTSSPSSSSLVPLSFLFPSPFRLIRLPPLHLPLYSHFSGIFISISLSLSGVGEAEYHLEKMAFLPTCRCTHTHTHTLENTHKLARLSIVSLLGGQLLN